MQERIAREKEDSPGAYVSEVGFSPSTAAYALGFLFSFRISLLQLFFEVPYINTGG